MTQANDHFKFATDGSAYAGDHLLVELWGAKYLTDTDRIRAALEQSAASAGATLLHSHYHQFGDNGGISGVSVLAESHITIHTWPERNYAAVDIFMCGGCDPQDCLPTLRRLLEPRELETTNIRRGRLSAAQYVA